MIWFIFRQINLLRKRHNNLYRITILMKTILFFIDSLGSGGAQRQIVQLALGFKERNYKVSFLIYNKAASKFYYEYLRENEIWIDDIDEQNYFRRIIKVRRYIRTFKPDVLVSRSKLFYGGISQYSIQKMEINSRGKKRKPQYRKNA